MDTDAKMIQVTGIVLTTIQIKYRESPIRDRMLMRPTLEQAIDDYTKYEIRLIREGIITGDDDLAAMQGIREEIDRAAATQALLNGLARFLSFVATRI